MKRRTAGRFPVSIGTTVSAMGARGPLLADGPERPDGGRLDVEPAVQERQADEHQQDERDEARGHVEDEAAFAVQVLGPLGSALGLQADLEVVGQEPRQQRHEQDQVQPVADDEDAAEEGARRRVEHDADEQPLLRVVRE